ncbi:hypothetical protein ACH4ND_13135 [Streptomyces sp. NPDC017179]|uniref:hypothetical protein n=1 Tax=Streptomyces sp. NPDC017179 TaxID=3364979 RepID=UPI0037ABC800
MARPHRPAGGRPGGEHIRVAVVEALPGTGVDHDRLGLLAGLGVVRYRFVLDGHGLISELVIAP